MEWEWKIEIDSWKLRVKDLQDEIEGLKFKLILALEERSWRDREINRLTRALKTSSRPWQGAKSRRGPE